MNDSMNNATQKIKVGFGLSDITPVLPTITAGGYDRLVDKVRSKLYATALAWESESGDVQGIIVSLDLLEGEDSGLVESVRSFVNGKLTGFMDLRKIVLFAIHTHNGPFICDTLDQLVPAIGSAIIAAWSSRLPGSVSHVEAGLNVGGCRISKYASGPDIMYGSVDAEGFTGFLSDIDRSMTLLYFFQMETLKGIVLNPGFPFQANEGDYEICPDIAGPLRDEFPGISIIPIIGAAGDQAPYDLSNGIPMQEQRGMLLTTEIAKVISDEIKKYIDDGTVMANRCYNLRQAHKVGDLNISATVRGNEALPAIETHAILFGDLLVVSNPFELYVDHGYAIKAGSMAPFTIIGQLSSGYNIGDYYFYLPTSDAEQGGGYGSNGTLFDAKNGQELVEQTIAFINDMFMFGPVTFHNYSDAVATGSWTVVYDVGAYKNERLRTGTYGDSIEFTFTGTGIKWFDAACESKGIAEVYIDGELKSIADSHSDIHLNQKEIYRETGLGNGTHTIKIVCLCKAGGNSDGFEIGVDFFAVIH